MQNADLSYLCKMFNVDLIKIIAIWFAPSIIYYYYGKAG